MARTKKLTREFDSAIDRDFLQNKILYDAFAKLAAEQDMYNMSQGYPVNGTTGELPIHKYGGRRKFQTAGLMTQGASGLQSAGYNNYMLAKFKNGDPEAEAYFSVNPKLLNDLIVKDAAFQANNPPPIPNTGISDIDDNEIRKIMADAASGDADAIEKSKSITQDDINRIAERDAIINQKPSVLTSKRGLGRVTGSVNPTIPEVPYVNNFTQPHALEDRLNADRSYQDTTFDKAAKWGAMAPGLVGIATAFQNNKKFGKFPHYTPKDMDTTALQNMLVNQGQLATNNATNAIRGANPGSSGAYMSNVGNISGRSQEETAKAIAQLNLSTGQINKQALDRSKEFNALQDEKANRAQEEMRGAKWTAAERGLNNIVQNLGAYSQEDKANWLGEQARLDQLALMQDLYPKKKYGGKLKKFKK